MTDDDIIKALEGCSCDTLELALDLINRQKAEIERNRRIIKMHEAVIEILEKDYIPAADVEPVKHGKWKLGKSGCMYFCSNCDLWVHPREAEAWKYYPNCGSRMDGEENG